MQVVAESSRHIIDEIAQGEDVEVKETKGPTVKFHQHIKGGQKETDGNGCFIIEAFMFCFAFL